MTPTATLKDVNGVNAGKVPYGRPVLGVIACAGPEGEDSQPSPTDETYWVELAEVVNASGAEQEPIEVEGRSEDCPTRQIVLATNLQEMEHHSHYLPVGQAVVLHCLGDQSNPTHKRWFFSLLPLAMAVIAGGAFNAHGAQSVNGIARYHAGRLYGLVSEPADGGMVFRDCAMFAGELYGCGDFTLNGSVSAQLVKWDAVNGRWVQVAISNFSNIYCLLAWDDGDGERLYAGGAGSGGHTTEAVQVFDGATWSAMAHDHDWVCWTLAAWDDGQGERLYGGGDWSITSGFYGIGRWNGDAWESLGSTGLESGGQPGIVFAICGHDDGSGECLYVGGRFDEADGSAISPNVARWRPRAGWEPLGAGLAVTPTGEVEALASYTPEGGSPLLFAGGTACEGRPVMQWGRGSWSPAGTPLMGGQEAVSPAESNLADLAVHAGRLVAAGSWTNRGEALQSIPMLRAARLRNTTGSEVWEQAGAGFNGSVHAAVMFGGVPVCGGAFDASGPNAMGKVGRWTGAAWEAMGGAFNGPIYALAVFDGVLYAGGEFTLCGSTEVNRLARWDGSEWQPVGDFNGPIYAMAASAGVLWIGGRFDRAGGQAGHLCLVGWDGADWIAVCGLIEADDDDPSVNALCLNAGTLYVAGKFTRIGSGPPATAASVAAMDTTTLSWSALGDGCAGELMAAAWYDSKLWVAGPEFSITVGSTHPITTLAYWTGAAWANGQGGSGFTWAGAIYSLAAFDDGGGEALFVGARGYSTYGVTRWEVRRRQGSSWTTLGQPSCGFDAAIRAMIFADEVWAFGEFQLNFDPTVNATLPEMLLAMMDGDGRWEHVAGGLGYNYHTYSGAVNSISGLRSLAFGGLRCKSLFAMGTLTIAAQGYGRYVAALGPLGWRPLQGGLYGNDGANMPGVRGVLRLAGGLILGGNFSGGINASISGPDQGLIAAVVSSPNCVRFTGRYWEAMGWTGGYINDLAWFGDQIVCAGYDPPYVYDEGTRTWSELDANIVAGGLIIRMVVFDSVLFMAGELISFAVPEESHYIVRNSGGSTTGDDPPDCNRADDVQVINDGEQDILFAAVHLQSEGNPIKYKTAAAGAWADWGGNLTGSAYSIGGVVVDGTLYLIAYGTFQVDGGADVDLVLWDGTTWLELAKIGIAEHVYSIRGFTNLGPPRILLAGEVWEAGLSDPKAAMRHILEWTPDDGLRSLSVGSVNSPVSVLA